MSAADQIVKKANRCLPAGFKAFGQFPLPWQDEDGVWHEPAADAIVMCVRRDPLGETPTRVDAMLHEADVGIPDDAFKERIIAPILAALEQHESEQRCGK